MSKPKQPDIEYRNYLLPASFPLILLGGDEWRISDVPSQTLHFHNCLEIGYCESDSGTMRFRGNEQAFRMGDITVVASNIPHTTFSSPGTASMWHYIFVNVEELFFPYFPVEVIGNHDVLSHMIREFHAVLPSHEHPDIAWLVTSIIREMQKKLGLSCPQPIYRWLRGRTLPSIDNLYTLSRILGLTVDDLLVPRQSQVWILQMADNLKIGVRLWAYYGVVNAHE